MSPTQPLKPFSAPSSFRLAIGASALALLIHIVPVPEFWVTLANYIGLYSLVALGLILLTGVTGMTSFGQAAFVGLGGTVIAALGMSHTLVLGI